MYSPQQLNKQTFFEPYFEELVGFRKQSEYSIQNWNLMDEEKDDGLQLIIQDVDEIGFGVGEYNMQSQAENDELDLDNFQTTLNVQSKNKSVEQTPDSEENSDSIPLSSKQTPKKAISPKTKKISKRSKPNKPSRHRLTLNKLCYQKNICRNIIRKAIRAVEFQTYESQILHLCNHNLQFYEKFKSILVGSVEHITGPRALKVFLEPEDDLSKVFHKFLVWYLKEKYLIDALTSGQMNNLEKYILFKNQVLLPFLKSI